MEKKPIKFYIMKHVKIPNSDDVSLLIQFTLPYSWYKTKTTDEICILLKEAFKTSGYFESPYSLPLFQSNPPKEWQEHELDYFDNFNCFQITFFDNEDNFVEPFYLKIANGIYSNSEDDFELLFDFVMPLKKYKEVPVENVCDNLNKSFMLCIKSTETLEEITQRYELHLFANNRK